MPNSDSATSNCTESATLHSDPLTSADFSPNAESTKQIQRVLSIQSTVVSGYVGNKASVFPLQLLGFDVDPLNTVQLSNHTSYPVFKGDRFAGEQIQTLMEGLEANGLLNYDYVLSGYLGTASTLPVINKWITRLKKDNPKLVFVLDPVMGDQGKLYVSEQHVSLYRHELLPLADVVLPNGFEAQTLTDVEIVDEASAMLAIRKLHEAGPKYVAITSVTFPGSTDILFYGSTRSEEAFVFKLKQLPVYFSGTGDLVSSLILAHLAKQSTHKNAFHIACTLALSTTQAVLRETYERMPTPPQNGARLSQSAELALVASRHLILDPTKTSMLSSSACHV